MKDNEAKIFNIFEFSNPEYFKVVNSLLLKSFIKKIWAVIKKMNGNISKIIAGEFNNAKKIVKKVSTSIFWKKSNSPKKFKINTKLISTLLTKSRDLKKIYVKNLI